MCALEVHLPTHRSNGVPHSQPGKQTQASTHRVLPQAQLRLGTARRPRRLPPPCRSMFRQNVGSLLPPLTIQVLRNSLNQRWELERMRHTSVPRDHFAGHVSQLGLVCTAPRVFKKLTPLSFADSTRRSSPSWSVHDSDWAFVRNLSHGSSSHRCRRLCDNFRAAVLFDHHDG